MSIAARFLRMLGYAFLGLLIVAIGLWGTAMLAYCGSFAGSSTFVWGGLFALVTLATLAALLLPTWRWRVLAGYGALFVALVFWFLSIEPSNDRDWQADVAELAYASIDGDAVTLHRIRNIDYRTETDFTPRYYDAVYSLRDLVAVDLVSVYWMGPAIAHTLVSFEFAGGRHVAISIETRKKKGDRYSTVKGFFRQFELYYVVADERDVIRLRTNFRSDPPEDVYVFRLRGDLDDGRRVFMEYMRKINALNVHPEFYNTLTSNCTTDIWVNTLVNADHLPFNWKVLVSGYLPQYLYSVGRLDNSVPFADLRDRSHINARAHAAGDSPDFSTLIRAPL